MGRAKDGYQLDFFLADPSVIHAKELRQLMAHCWFSLAKDPRYEPIRHSVGESTVEITASDEDVPLATIWDHDILIFLISQVVHMVDAGRIDPRQPGLTRGIQFSGYEYFRFLRKRWRRGGIGFRNYQLLWNALQRLHRTHVKTDIRSGSLRGESQFYWLPMIRQLQDTETGQHYGYLAELPSWLYQQIVQTAADGQRLVNVVGLDPGYFDLTGGLERWLYLWARKSVDARRGDWEESFRSLYLKSGSTNSEKQFRFNLRKIIRRNAMLGYELSEIFDRRGPRLGVVRRTGSDLLMSVNQLRLV